MVSPAPRLLLITQVNVFSSALLSDGSASLFDYLHSNLSEFDVCDDDDLGREWDAECESAQMQMARSNFVATGRFIIALCEAGEMCKISISTIHRRHISGGTFPSKWFPFFHILSVCAFASPMVPCEWGMCGFECVHIYHFERKNGAYVK